MGIIDVVSDFFNASNLISGQFTLGLYIASVTQGEYTHAPNFNNIGWLILAIPWLTGLARISFVALEEPWRGVPANELAMRKTGYAMALLAWPVLPNFM